MDACSGPSAPVQRLADCPGERGRVEFLQRHRESEGPRWIAGRGAGSVRLFDHGEGILEGRGNQDGRRGGESLVRSLDHLADRRVARDTRQRTQSLPKFLVAPLFGVKTERSLYFKLPTRPDAGDGGKVGC